MSTAARLIPIHYYPNSADWFVQIRKLKMPIWLDSGYPQSNYGRFDIISAAPDITISTRGKSTLVEKQGFTEDLFGNPFTLLKAYLPQTSEKSEQLPFCGGALGYFGYDLARQLETIPELARSDIDLPDMCVGIFPWAIIQDHHLKLAWLVVNRSLAPAYNFLEIEQICSHERQGPRFHDLKKSLNTKTKTFNINKFNSNLKVESYRTSLQKIQKYIVAGDCYQVNFAQRFSTQYEGDTFEAYLKLRESLPSPFSAYLELETSAVLSLSPERFIKVEDRKAETKPIKGTIARGKTPEEDIANASALEASLKDRAENLMIVDLLRNDLSKTCTDVRVPSLFSLQSFANVHHLVSTVTGTLKHGATALDVLAHSFPGGSITGAPKIRAMEIIEELEPIRRSIYCGSIGYISACGNMDTNIAIRTLVCDKNNIHCWGGGGIVADSDADKEYQESIAKVKLLLDTLEQHFNTQNS